MKNITLLGACLLALLPLDVSAQIVDGGAEPKFVFGPLGLTPRFAIKDLGIDSNPRNLAEGADSDFTVTVAPGVDSALRVGRGRIFGRTSLEYVYFNEAASQRSFNFNQDARAELLLNRVTPFAVGSYLRTRQRPNLEIDARVQQNTRGLGGGAAVKVGTRTRVEFEGRRTELDYGDGKYGDEAIAQALNRDSDLYSVTTGIALTPLTMFVIRGERQTDRFAFSPVRNSDSVTVLPGFEFKPSALIAGKVMVGYRQFDAIDRSVPDFGGIVGELDARYTWRDQTRFNFKAIRNVDYSIEEVQPYFVTNSGGLDVTQSIGLNWYVVARGSRGRLVYRDFLTAAGSTSSGVGRSDRVDAYGVGFGRRLRDDVRVGVDLNKVRRLSTLRQREYDGYRVGVTISYGS